MKIYFPLLTSILFFACQSTTTKVATKSPEIKDTTVHEVSLADEERFAFAYLNFGRDSILCLENEEDSLSQPAELTLIFANNESQGIQYVNYKAPTSADNGRQTAYNFDHAGGQLYSTEKMHTETSHALLANAAFARKRSIIAVQGVRLPSLPTRALSNAKWKNREIKENALVARGKDMEITITTFAPVADTALAVLAFLSDTKTIYYEMPALYDETSTWSVDDGGTFGSDYFNILQVFSYEGKIELLTLKFTTEGYIMQLLREENNNFKVVKEVYGYSAPL